MSSHRILPQNQRSRERLPDSQAWTLPQSPKLLARQKATVGFSHFLQNRVLVLNTKQGLLNRLTNTWKLKPIDQADQLADQLRVFCQSFRVHTIQFPIQTPTCGHLQRKKASNPSIAPLHLRIVARLSTPLLLSHPRHVNLRTLR